MWLQDHSFPRAVLHQQAFIVEAKIGQLPTWQGTDVQNGSSSHPPLLVPRPPVFEISQSSGGIPAKYGEHPWFAHTWMPSCSSWLGSIMCMRSDYASKEVYEIERFWMKHVYIQIYIT